MPGMLLRLVVLASVAGVITPAAANDAPVQRALSQAACAGARLERLSEQGSTSVYRADCTKSSHRRLIVVCTREACRVAPEHGQTEE